MESVFRDAEGVIRVKIHALGHNNQWNTYYDTLPRLRQVGPGRGLCIIRERESFSTTVQPHTAHLGHGLFQSFHLELLDHLPYAPAPPA
jgi:hypothetical protein